MSDLVRKTTVLPALTRGQLDFISGFHPYISIKNITKPHRDLWEIDGYHEGQYGKRIIIFLTVDGIRLGNASACDRMYAEAYRFNDWNRWLGARDIPTKSTSDFGLYGITPNDGLLADLRKWCVEQVVNRKYPRECDYYGRIWPEGLKLCPVCGQPDDEDEFCDHRKISDKLVQAIKSDL